MQRSTFLCVSSAGLYAILVSVAFAAHSTSTKIDDGASEACTRQGGIVSTMAEGKICTTPPSTCISKSSSGAIYSIDPNNASMVATCFDACGSIAAGNGTATCTIKASAIERHDVPFGPSPAPISAPNPSGNPH